MAQTHRLRRPGSSPGEATNLMGEWRNWNTRSPQKTMPLWIERSNRSSPTISCWHGETAYALALGASPSGCGFKSLCQHQVSTWYSGCATVSKTVESSSILLVLAKDDFIGE